jgi:isoamylase
LRVATGRPLPLGVEAFRDGFNFAVFSRHAERVELVLYDDADSAAPMAAITLDPASHRTGDVWHAQVEGLRFGQAYAYRVHGPFAPDEGHRFDGSAILVDPYALATRRMATNHPPRPTDRRSLIVDRAFDWQGTTRPKRPWPQTVIYETHVRGLTIDASSGATHPGTFLGVVEKLPYLVSLGVTAVELMPVQEFEASANAFRDPATGAKLADYWGYDTIAFFAPNEAYGTGSAPGCQVAEFKTMVRALHRAGIEVILDVVFNHTAEGDERGPTFGFRGFDNAIYYLLEEDKRRYRNYSGCGNTLNCNHPVVRNYVVGCLRYWATEMQVDGFRFDLASILGRDEDGRMMANPPLLERIAEDPILREVKLIAEAWDAGGAYQVGRFHGQRWAEWNGRFRDDVRRFWRGDPGMTGALAQRLCGSADLYQGNGKAPVNSINFVTCHDGFTLNDLVSYARKHNEANGEMNRDGDGAHDSANYGVEGLGADPAIDAIRLRQIKNMLATLLVSRGVPMVLGGDEFRRTQNGNSNAYCQDNAVSWTDWRLADMSRDLVRFVRAMIELRRRHPVLSADAFYADGELRWFGPGGAAPDWDGPTRALGVLVRPRPGKDESQLCLLFNAGEDAVTFDLPAPAGAGWRVAADTGGEETRAPGAAPYRLGGRSFAILSD